MIKVVLLEFEVDRIALSFLGRSTVLYTHLVLQSRDVSPQNFMYRLSQ